MRSPHRPRKSLGQHFLVDPNLQRKIVDAIRPGPADTILEIGPGRGALTRHLLGKCRRLLLVELDRALAKELEAEFGAEPGVEVIQRDILRTRLSDFAGPVGELKIIGNLPYNLTTPILFHLLRRPRPAEAIVMVQKEVGQRILAPPGSAYGALTVGVQSVAEVERLFAVPRSAFRPVPAVESVVLRIVPTRPAPLTEVEEERLRVLTRAAFQWRRKQFQTVLRHHSDLGLTAEDTAQLQAETGLDLRRRPETFSPEEFIALSRSLERHLHLPGPVGGPRGPEEAS